MTKMKADILIRNGLVVTMDRSRSIYSPGAVAVIGRDIAAVGNDRHLSEQFEPAKVIDARSGIVHPGFVDAHNHIVHTSCRGVFNGIHDAGGAPVNFAAWKADVTSEEEAAATSMACLEMMHGGFTMFIEPGSLFATDATAEAIDSVGLRALVAPTYLWDRPEPFEAIPALMSPNLMARAPIDTNHCLAQLGAELHRNRDAKARVRGYVFIYGEGTASPELLQAAHALARDNGVPFHLHAGYTPAGADLYQRLHGKRHLVHLADLGVLDAGSTLVHGNAFDDDEEAALADSGAQVVWCPAAFFSLGISTSAPYRITARHAAGMRIALGADAALDCPPGATMLAARFASQTYGEALTPEALLEMQTLGGASVAGMMNEIGSLEASKRADIVIRRAQAAEGHPDNNPCHLLALILGPGSVDTVLVDGRVVLDGGVSTQVDEAEVYERVSASVRARAKRLGFDPAPRWPVVTS